MTDNENFYRQGPPDEVLNSAVGITAYLTTPCDVFYRLYKQVRFENGGKHAFASLVHHWMNCRQCLEHSKRVGPKILDSMQLPVCEEMRRALEYVALGQQLSSAAFDGFLHHLSWCPVCCATAECPIGLALVDAVYADPTQATMDALAHHMDACPQCQAKLEAQEKIDPPTPYYERIGRSLSPRPAPVNNLVPQRRGGSPGVSCGRCGYMNDPSDATCAECGTELAQLGGMQANPIHLEKMEAFAKKNLQAVTSVTCPKCRASNHPYANYCSQCLVDLRPEPKTLASVLKSFWSKK